MSQRSETAETQKHEGRVERWLGRLSRTKSDLPLWFSASFAETIIVPIPIELVLLPYMAMNRDRLWRTALIVTIGCLAASLVGYGIGLLFFETAGRWIIDAMGWGDAMQRFRDLFNEYGFLSIVAVGVIPIPFQVAMLAAGAAGYPILLFALAATIARGLRYLGLAVLVYWLGDSAEALFKRHQRSSAIILTVLFAAVIGYLIFKAA